MTELSDLGIESYCFRAIKDNGAVIDALRECGLSRIELCFVHADFSDPAAFQKIAALYRGRGVAISSIFTPSFAGNEARERNYFECARGAGIAIVTSDFVPAAAPESYRVAEKLCAEYQVNLAVHNHGRKHWLNERRRFAEFLQGTSERIGLCLDTAFVLEIGEDPVSMIGQFSSRLFGVHIKDCTLATGGETENAILGEGQLDLRRLMLTLRDISFQGSTVIEYEHPRDSEHPVPALKRCVQAVRKAMAGI